MIRPAHPADLAACLALARAAFHLDDDKPTADWFLEHLARPGAALSVCTHPFSVCGFVLTHPTTRGRTMVPMIATSPDCRRSGVARSLLATVRPHACTWIRSDNEASQGLFRGAGWREVFEGDGWGWWELVARPPQGAA